MCDVLLDATAEGPQQAVDAVDLGLELGVDARAAAGCLPFQVDALTVVSSTPRAGGFG